MNPLLSILLISCFSILAVSAPEVVQQAKEQVSNVYKVVSNPMCFDAQKAAFNSVRSILGAVRYLIPIDLIPRELIFEIVFKVFSVETLKAIRENMDPITLAMTILKGYPKIVKLMAKMSLGVLKKVAGKIQGHVPNIADVPGKLAGRLNPWGQNTETKPEPKSS